MLGQWVAPVPDCNLLCFGLLGMLWLPKDAIEEHVVRLWAGDEGIDNLSKRWMRLG